MKRHVQQVYSLDADEVERAIAEFCGGRKDVGGEWCVKLHEDPDATERYEATVRRIDDEEY